jgi:acetyl esterase/lipase
VSPQATTSTTQHRLAIDLRAGFILGGTSAGANFTAGIAHLARDENLSPPLTGLAFLAGNVCHPDVRPAEYEDRILSVDEINDAPGLTRKSIDFFAGKSHSPSLQAHRSSPQLTAYCTRQIRGAAIRSAVLAPSFRITRKSYGESVLRHLRLGSEAG